MYLELAVALATWYNKNYISLDKREKAFDYRKYEYMYEVMDREYIDMTTRIYSSNKDIIEAYYQSQKELYSDIAEELSKIKRENTYEEIKESGFDIKANAEKLEEFYLNAYKGIDR